MLRILTPQQLICNSLWIPRGYLAKGQHIEAIECLQVKQKGPYFECNQWLVKNPDVADTGTHGYMKHDKTCHDMSFFWLFGLQFEGGKTFSFFEPRCCFANPPGVYQINFYSLFGDKWLSILIHSVSHAFKSPGPSTVFILWTLMSQGSIETCVFLLCFVRFATSTAEEFQGVARWGGSLSAAGILLFPPRVVQSALSTFVGPACHLSAFEGLGDWIRWKLSGDGSQVPSMSLR